jgi:hypothetical protein
MLVLLEYSFQHTLPHKKGSSSHPCMNCLMTSQLHASKANRRQALCMQDSLTLKQLETGDVCLPFVVGTCVHSLFHPSTPSSNKVHFPAFDFSSALLCFFSSISFFSSSLSSSHFCLFFFIYHTYTTREAPCFPNNHAVPNAHASVCYHCEGAGHSNVGPWPSSLVYSHG